MCLFGNIGQHGMAQVFGAQTSHCHTRLVDRDGENADQLAGVEDFLLAKALRRGAETLAKGTHPAAPTSTDSRG